MEYDQTGARHIPLQRQHTRCHRCPKLLRPRRGRRKACRASLSRADEILPRSCCRPISNGVRMPVALTCWCVCRTSRSIGPGAVVGARLIRRLSLFVQVCTVRRARRWQVLESQEPQSRRPRRPPAPEARAPRVQPPLSHSVYCRATSLIARP